jgi:chromosome segregation ATPase
MKYTSNYKIPLYEDNDPTSYLTTYNETMELIDESLHALALKVANGEVNDRQFTAEISAIKGRLDTAENTINTLKTELATTNGKVSENAEDISTLETQLVEQGTSIKNLLARVSALEAAFESFKTAQEQKNSSYEDTLSSYGDSLQGLSMQLSNETKKQDLKNNEFNNRITENTENIESLKRGTNVLVNFKNISATEDGGNLQVDLQTNRENAELELNKWQNAQVCANITVRDNTQTVICKCSPVFSRNLGTTNTEEFDFVDPSNPSGTLYNLQTILSFDDTTQNVSLECTISNAESITSATFTIALFLIV